MGVKRNNHYSESNHFVMKNEWGGKWTIKKTIRYIVYPFLNLFYKIFVLFLKKPRYNKKYNISVCSIFKNEAPFFKEWIEYHLLVGVDHFYLYNNNSTDNYKEVLKPYIDRGIVTLTEWPEIPGQISSYRNWYENYRNETQWVSLIDLDEFICPLYDENLQSLLDRFSHYPVLVMYWLFFGTSGKLTNENNELLIEEYTTCWNKICPTGKIIYNTDYDIKEFNVSTPHHLKVKFHGLTIPPFNDSGYAVCWENINYIKPKKMMVQLNHYASRSLENVREKIGRGSAAFAKSWKTMDLSMQKEFNCKSKNYTIHRYLLQLKMRMNNIEL